MRINEIDIALSICGRHIEDSGALDPEIEWFLAQYVLVRIRANFEERIRVLISEPLNEITDEYARRVARHGVSRVIRGSRTSHISETLQQIDPNLRAEFRRRVSDTEKERSFNFLAISRNRTAHSASSNLTLDSLSRHYEIAHLVLDDLRDSISAWRADGGGA